MEACKRAGYTGEKFNHPVFKNPNDIKQLIDLCQGNEGLDWLVEDLLEYTYLFMDDLVDGILKFDMSKASALGINKKGINHELVYFVIGMLINQPDYQVQSIYDPMFIKSACTHAIQESQLIAPKEIKTKLQEFVQFKKSILSEAGTQFSEQIKAFNKAWKDNDLLNIQRKWYKLSATLNIVAIGQIIGNERLEYDEQEEIFDNKSKKHYRFLPSIANQEGKFSLEYHSKNTPSKDDTPLDITNVFSYLKHRVDVVKDTVAKYAKDAKARKDTNFVSSELIFIVGSEPYNNKTGGYKRLFVKIPIKFGDNPLISLKEIVPDPRAVDFQKNLSDESEQGIEILDSLKLNKSSSTFCSERALFISFKNPDFMSRIITKLQDTIENDNRFRIIKSEEKFKVYGVVLTEYSTFTSCDRCCGATVFHQHSESGFLKLLEQSINTHNGKLQFFTKGSNKGESKFNMMTFVASGQSYNTQTDDVLVPVGNPTYNSSTQIFLEKDSLDLNIYLSSAKTQPLIEFPNFTANSNIDTNYYGSVYMSGASKDEKYNNIADMEVKLAGLEANQPVCD